jgi:hypothetical protein
MVFMIAFSDVGVSHGDQALAPVFCGHDNGSGQVYFVIGFFLCLNVLISSTLQLVAVEAAAASVAR